MKIELNGNTNYLIENGDEVYISRIIGRKNYKLLLDINPLYSDIKRFCELDDSIFIKISVIDTDPSDLNN